MAKSREHITLEDDPIDLEELTTPPQAPPSDAEYSRMREAGKKFGFVDRFPSAKKTRLRSPYVIQHNSKMRIGMKELLADLTASIGAKSDQETLELAILALIEQKGNKELLQQYRDITE
jgi:hypothetical protein